MSICKIQLKDIDRIEFVEYVGGCTPSKIKRLYNPDIFINGVLFDNKTRKIITNTKTINTGKQGYLFSENGIGIKDNKPIWTNKWDALKDDGVTGFIGSAPSLIVNGEINIDKKDITDSFYGTTTYRSGIGFNDKELVLYSGGERRNFSNYSKFAATLGVDYFINLDGGGSCCLYKNGKQLNSEYDGRLIPMWILVYLKKNISEGDDEMVIKKNISIDGKVKECDVIVKDGTTYVKLRDFESEGYEITYVNGVAGINCPKK